MTETVRRHRPTGLALASLLLVSALWVGPLSPARAAEGAASSASAAHGDNSATQGAAAKSASAASPGRGARPAAAPEAASSAARAALEQLLGAPTVAETGEPAVDARTTTTVRAGETLDVIIRRTLGDTPFKENLLRAAFVEANPRLYPNGNIQRLPTGTPVQVPSAADLRRHLLRALGSERAAALAGGAKPAAPRALEPAPLVVAAPAPSEATSPPPASASLPPAPPRPDHRGWVRFPG